MVLSDAFAEAVDGLMRDQRAAPWEWPKPRERLAGWRKQVESTRELQQDDVDMLHSNFVERDARGDVLLFGFYICCDKNPCEHESKKERQCERSSS